MGKLRVKKVEGAGKVRVPGTTGTNHEREMGAAGDGHGGHGHARGWAEVPITPLMTYGTWLMILRQPILLSFAYEIFFSRSFRRRSRRHPASLSRVYIDLMDLRW